MDNPIADIYSKITSKFEILRMLLYNDISQDNVLSQIQNNIRSISSFYMFLYNTNEYKKHHIINEYMKQIVIKKINITLDNIYSKLKKDITKYPDERSKKLMIFNRYESICYNIDSKEYLDHSCKNCKENTAIVLNKTLGEYHCAGCFEVLDIKEQSNKMNKHDFAVSGIEYDELKIKNNDIKNKNKFESNKHFKTKLDQYLNIKNPNISSDKEKEIDIIVKKWCISNNIYNMELLKFEDLRKCFKETKITKYNNLVPHFLTKYTKVAQELLTYEEYETVIHIFDVFKNAYYKIKDSDDSNIKSYAFLTHRIIDAVLDDAKNPSCRERKQYILNNIHLPDESTVLDLDRLVSELSKTPDVKKTIFRYKPINIYLK
jgi:hypothetical protein